MQRLAVLAAVVLTAVAGAAVPSARAQPKPAGAKPIVIDRVAAVINDTVVLESEVVERATPLLAEMQQDAADNRTQAQRLSVAVRQALDMMIDEELIMQAAAEAKLEVTEAEVDKAVAEVKRQNRLTDQQLTQALAQQGYSIPEYRRDVRRQILRLRALNVLVRPRVQVADEDVRAAYEKLSGQSATVTEVQVRHILITLPERASAAQVDAARRRAGELVARARAGEDFAQLASAQSDDDGTKGAGGELGWYKRGELPTEWEEILFAMAAGEVRGPVRGPRGLHVFKVTDVKKETVRPFDEVKDQIREQLTNEQMEKETKLYLEELRKKAHVETKL